MTREEAVAILNHAKDQLEYPHGAYGIALDMAIKALEQEPICPSRGIDCEDCPAYDPRVDAIIRAEVKRIVDEIPKQRTGHWIDTDPDDACLYMCSKCHGRADIKFDYCPNCGCRMIEPKCCDRNICIQNECNVTEGLNNG